MVFQKHGKASADATFFMIHDIDFKCFADDPNPVTIQSIVCDKVTYNNCYNKL